MTIDDDEVLRSGTGASAAFAPDERWPSIAAEFIPGHEELRAAMDRRRRSRSAPQRIIEKLLGFDVKLRQYEQGKKWADGVAQLAGIDGLNRVWASPDALPNANELKHPRAWVKRTEPPRLTAA